jgi:hypothetical protein
LAPFLAHSVLVLGFEYLVFNHFAYALWQKQCELGITIILEFLLHQRKQHLEDVSGFSDFQQNEQQFVNGFDHFSVVL